jgi:hypothetical protein
MQLSLTPVQVTFIFVRSLGDKGDITYGTILLCWVAQMHCDHMVGFVVCLSSVGFGDR